MDNKTIHIDSSIGSNMLDLVERHEITGIPQTGLMLGKKEENACYINSFSLDLDNADIYLEDQNDFGVLLYSFFQNEDAEKAKQEFLASSKKIPNNVLFGLVNFEHFLLFKKTKDNLLEPIKNFIFEQKVEEEKVAG